MLMVLTQYLLKIAPRTEISENNRESEQGYFLRSNQDRSHDPEEAELRHDFEMGTNASSNRSGNRPERIPPISEECRLALLNRIQSFTTL